MRNRDTSLSWRRVLRRIADESKFDKAVKVWYNRVEKERD